MLLFQIDPGLLALAGVAENDDIAALTIEQLAHWSEARAYGLKLCQSSGLADCLGAANAYPLLDSIREFLRCHHLEERYSAVDVLNIYAGLLRDTPTIRDVFGFESETATNITLAPDLSDLIYPIELRGAALNGFASLSLGQCAFRSEGPFCYVSGSSAPTDVSVLAEITEVAGNVPELISLPVTVFGVVPVISNLVDILRVISPEGIWRAAKSAEDLYFGIKLKVVQLKIAEGSRIDFEDVPSFFIGSEFIGSLERNQALGKGAFADIVLESCARIVMSRPRRAVGDLRQGRKGIVSRPSDGAIAQRTQVTKRGEALRLMFWATPSGPEFATLGVKFELEIARGRLADRIGG